MTHGANVEELMGEHTRVLFICPHGAAKSVLAAALFNKQAAVYGLSVMATAAGTEPDPQFLPGVVATVRELGLDVSGQRPRQATAAEVQAAGQVVSFGCDVGGLLGPGQAVIRWNDVPPPSHDFDAARAVIAAHVGQFVDEGRTERISPS